MRSAEITALEPIRTSVAAIPMEKDETTEDNKDNTESGEESGEDESEESTESEGDAQ